MLKQIEQTYKINAPIDKVWQAFIDPEIINNWGGGPAVMSNKEGTEFSLWDGEIHGKNTKIVSMKSIDQDWFSGEGWDKPSKLTFSFTSENNKTVVHLLQKEVPENEFKDIEIGWKVYYLGPLKKFVEQ